MSGHSNFYSPVEIKKEIKGRLWMNKKKWNPM